MELVSVYIPTRNRMTQVIAAIDSVVRQSYANIEILVVDDCSTDGTFSALQAYAERESRLRVFRSEGSRGACAARNQAILHSTGEFLTGLDDDDEFTPNHISGLVDYWKLLKAQGILPSCLYVQYEFRSTVPVLPSCKHGCATSDDLFDANQVGNQIFAPKAHFIEAGLFDEEMPAWQDLEFFYRVLKHFGPARLLDIRSYIFDVSPRPDRISGQQKARIKTACMRMFKKHGEGDPRKFQRLILQMFSSYYGFSVSFWDFYLFARQGLWLRGYLLFFFRMLGKDIAH